MKKLLFLFLAIPFFVTGQTQVPIWKQHDKQAHFFAGAVISTGVYHIYYQKTGKKTDAIVVALASTFVVSVLKETFDTNFKKGGVFEVKDINATMLGATLVVPLSIFDKNKKK